MVAVDYTAPGGAVLVQITLTTGATSRLTHPEAFRVGMPSVSPDGEFIAFAGQRNTTPDYDETKNHIWLLDRSGEPRKLAAFAASPRSVPPAAVSTPARIGPAVKPA